MTRYLALELCAMTLHDAMVMLATKAADRRRNARALSAGRAGTAAGSGAHSEERQAALAAAFDEEVEEVEEFEEAAGEYVAGLAAVRGALADVANGVAFLHERYSALTPLPARHVVNGRSG